MVETATTALKAITRDELAAALRVVQPVFVRQGVTHMALFGSRARRDNRPDSDVDLVIEGDPSAKFSLIDLLRVEHAIEDRIGLPANVLVRRGLRPDFREELDRDGVDIF